MPDVAGAEGGEEEAPAPKAAAIHHRLLKSKGAGLADHEIEELNLPLAIASVLPAAATLPVERLVERSEEAVAKALVGGSLDEVDQETLEALVLPELRPIIDVQDGTLTNVPETWKSMVAAHGAMLTQALPAVGRIDLPLHDSYAGTGFFIAENLILTNRHVAKHFISGVGVQSLRFRAVGGAANLDPAYEVGTPDPGSGKNRFKVRAPVLIHPHWDLALLEVEPLDNAVVPTPLRLARQAPPGLGAGSAIPIAAIGYPNLDDRNDIAKQIQIFRNVFGRKRLMPGMLGKRQKYKSKMFGTEVLAVTHDASTLGGNSGSAVIDLSSGLVVGLHFGGEYLVANYAVPTWELALDSHLSSRGVAFYDMPGASPVAASLVPDWMDAWKPLEEAAQTAPPAPKLLPLESPILPAARDWFERTTDAELAEALRRDPSTTEALLHETLGNDAEDTIRDLRQVLTAEEAGKEEGLLDAILGRTSVDATLPEIVFLHGIMGSHLATSTGLGGRVWLSPLSLFAGGVARKLMMHEDGERDLDPRLMLRPDGHLRFSYAKATRKWRLSRFVVHEFSFDWRKPLESSAARLHHFIENLRLDRPGKRFAIVAHSMGGVVAAMYASRYPEWSSRISQAILLGSPLRGSYVPVEAMLGEYGLFPPLAFADLQDNVQDLTIMACSLPGLIDLLPDPEIFPDVAPLYEKATWPSPTSPKQAWLDHSLQVKRALSNSPLLASAKLIVAADFGTTAGVSVTAGQLRTKPRNKPGDGTVPIRSASASVPGVTAYLAAASHGDLPRDDATVAAVSDLLRTGRCDLPLLTAHDLKDRTLEESSSPMVVSEEAVVALRDSLGGRVMTRDDVDRVLRGMKLTR
jgi:pimeloyl-ACP methyl ester carboxylesterase/S1-C subfamily serine protease